VYVNNRTNEELSPVVALVVLVVVILILLVLITVALVMVSFQVAIILELVVTTKAVIKVEFTFSSSVSFPVVVLFRLNLGHVRVVSIQHVLLIIITIGKSSLFLYIISVFIQLVMLVAHLCVDLVIANSHL